MIHKDFYAISEQLLELQIYLQIVIANAPFHARHFILIALITERHTDILNRILITSRSAIVSLLPYTHNEVVVLLRICI